MIEILKHTKELPRTHNNIDRRKCSFSDEKERMTVGKERAFYRDAKIRISPSNLETGMRRKRQQVEADSKLKCS
jgi:hypothetical protein